VFYSVWSVVRADRHGWWMCSLWFEFWGCKILYYVLQIYTFCTWIYKDGTMNCYCVMGFMLLAIMCTRQKHGNICGWHAQLLKGIQLWTCKGKPVIEVPNNTTQLWFSVLLSSIMIAISSHVIQWQKPVQHTIHPAWCAGGWWFTLVGFPLDGELVDAGSLKPSATFPSVCGGAF